MELNKAAEILDVSHPTVYALVRTGQLPAIKVGGRGQWRVEHDKLEEFIQASYQTTRAQIGPGQARRASSSGP